MDKNDLVLVLWVNMPYSFSIWARKKSKGVCKRSMLGKRATNHPCRLKLTVGSLVFTLGGMQLSIVYQMNNCWWALMANHPVLAYVGLNEVGNNKEAFEQVQHLQNQACFCNVWACALISSQYILVLCLHCKQNNDHAEWGCWCCTPCVQSQSSPNIDNQQKLKLVCNSWTLGLYT